MKVKDSAVPLGRAFFSLITCDVMVYGKGNVIKLTLISCFYRAIKIFKYLSCKRFKE